MLNSLTSCLCKNKGFWPIFYFRGYFPQFKNLHISVTNLNLKPPTNHLLAAAINCVLVFVGIANILVSSSVSRHAKEKP